jgi:hypothetical protein
MKPLAWMVAAGLGSWALAIVVSGGRVGPEVLFGMVGPLAGAVASWVAYERAHRSAPGTLMKVMVGALALKMLFFGAYVVVMVRVLAMRPVPFVVSFASYFIALHAMEALFLRRLLMDDLRSPGRERV